MLFAHVDVPLLYRKFVHDEVTIRNQSETCDSSLRASFFPVNPELSAVFCPAACKKIRLVGGTRKRGFRCA
jgi:hypothetical protein